MRLQFPHSATQETIIPSWPLKKLLFPLLLPRDYHYLLLATRDYHYPLLPPRKFHSPLLVPQEATIPSFSPHRDYHSPFFPQERLPFPPSGTSRGYHPSIWPLKKLLFHPSGLSRGYHSFLLVPHLAYILLGTLYSTWLFTYYGSYIEHNNSIFWALPVLMPPLNSELYTTMPVFCSFISRPSIVCKPSLLWPLSKSFSFGTFRETVLDS